MGRKDESQNNDEARTHQHPRFNLCATDRETIAGENQSRAFTFRGKPPVDRKTEGKILRNILAYLESMDARIVALEQKQAHRERTDQEHQLESLARPVGSPGEMN